ncbi:MAG TPA: Asp-tRNA(Asn)/Glu-tRNA(Gln) amidotransferase subunit GatB [Thermoanaerobaculia bacterium]|nr:Asp-tRNA(Asn)/Glu-tRNA(Gln) amidotransferase subunit GatB [Thermoanaerobaculia bacterium]
MPEWEAVIGLEVHAHLLTATKIFCACATSFAAPPNTHVCPVCLGYPGALPVLNRKAVELALRAALATGCEIQHRSIFARKNYFYPDLPKGYQNSQFDRPLATAGFIRIRAAEGERNITIQRIHMEEDAGKLLHEHMFDDVSSNVSLVDLNRAGTPLIEIVSEPEMRTADEAHSYLTRLRQLLMYTGVCDGNMEEGSLRCDANVSVRHFGEPLGTRTEIKNLNSFRFLGRAIEFEIGRQVAVLESGGRVVQETRLFDPGAGETRVMRSIEEAHDYRYFPEPDLLLLDVSSEWIEDVRRSLPELPTARMERYQRALALPYADAEALVATRELSDYYDATAEASANPKLAANWVRNEVLRVLNDRKIGIESYRVTPAMLGRLIKMIESGAIGGKIAKEVFEEMSTSGEAPEAMVERKGLSQISDPAAIREAAQRVLEKNAGSVEQYRGGKAQVFGFLVGQLMKETRGKAKAELANEILKELLGEISTPS